MLDISRAAIVCSDMHVGTCLAAFLEALLHADPGVRTLSLTNCTVEWEGLQLLPAQVLCTNCTPPPPPSTLAALRRTKSHNGARI